MILHIYRPLISALVSLLVVSAALSGCNSETPEEKFARLVEKGKIDLDAGNVEEARISYLAAIQTKGDDIDSYLQLGKIYLKQKKFGKALGAYRTALDTDGTSREARLNLATLLLAGRQLETAESHIYKLLEADPEDAQALVLNANVLAMRKDIPAAKEKLQQALAIDPKNAAALANLADIALAEKDPALAEDYFQKSIAAAENPAPIQLSLANLYISQSRHDEAKDVLEHLVATNPDNASLSLYFGEFLLKQGSIGGAEEQYKKTLQADPNQHIARDRLFDLYTSRKQPEQAIALADSLKIKGDDNAGNAYFQGRVKEMNGEVKEALVLYVQAIDSMQRFAPVFRRAGIIEIYLGKTTEGFEHLNQAITLAPNDVGARLTLARELMKQREFAQAKQHLVQVISAYPRQLGANIMLADIAVLENQFEQAEKLYKFLAKAFPKNPLGTFKLGLLEEKRGNFPKAIEYYAMAISFDNKIYLPAQRYASLMLKTQGYDKTVDSLRKIGESSKNSKPEAAIVLAAVLAQQPEHRETARKLLSDAVNKRPDIESAYFLLGRLDTQLGKASEAEATYRQIVEKQPENISGRVLLGLNLESQGKPTEAAQQYEEVLKISPRFAIAANNLAYLYAEDLNRDLDRALELATIAKEELPKHGGVTDTLGWIHYKRGTPRAALGFLKEAVDLTAEPGNPEVVYHLGVVQAELKDFDAAKKTFAKADALAPVGHPAKAKIKAALDKIANN